MRKPFGFGWLLLLVAPSVNAQSVPKLELFGGYSVSGFPGEPRYVFAPKVLDSWNNGWQASARLSVSSRLGLVADAAGQYGRWGLDSFTLPAGRMEFLPAGMRRHTFLFGPEARVFSRGRLTLNARALIGAAHSNRAVLPLRTPVLGLAERAFPAANAFAASFGGSADYRIAHGLAWRIVQPELVLTRAGGQGTEHWNQAGLRLSTGVVFAVGRTDDGGPAPRISFGLLGGAALTDGFNHDTSGYIIGMDGQLQPVLSRAYSTLKDYVIGPAVQIGLPWRNAAIEIDALYRPLNLTNAGVRPDGSLHSVSPATVVTWQFPVMAKYTFGSGAVKPFLEAGPSFRASGNLNNAFPSAYGGTAGIGFEAHAAKLKFGPVLRYTHWASDGDFVTAPVRRNQVELLLGVSF